ncbi:MAG: hypothetical protein CSB06_02890 [Bacteroidia bacterium]|nr:MAG: hypothetical protein CSB06_02890 [Bacteroidia bacterium]
MKRRNYTAAKVFLAWVIVFFAASLQQANAQRFKEGYLDLSDYDFEKDGNFILKGQWEFYPNSFYVLEGKKKYIQVPSRWDENTFPDQDHVNNYGVYHLLIKLPEKHPENLALRLGGISTAYTLQVNGKEITKVGLPGRDKKKSIPQTKIVTQNFYIETQVLDLRIIVSNFHHRSGGIENAPVLGVSNKVQRLSDSEERQEGFLIGALLLAIVFFLGMYFWGKRESVILYFILGNFFQVIYMLCVGEILISHLLPNLPWVWLMKIRYVANAARIIFSILFLYLVYASYMKKRFIQILVLINILVVLLTVVTPVSIFFPSVFLVLLSIFVMHFYTFYGQIKELVQRKPGALIPFLGLLFMNLTTIYDTLVVFGVIDSGFISAYGFFAFTFAQMYLLSFQSIWTLKELETEIASLSKSEQIQSLFSDSSITGIQEVLGILAESFSASQVYFYTKEPGEELLLKATFPDPERVNVSDILLRHTISQKKGRLVENISESPYAAVLSKQLNLKALMCVPFVSEDAVRAMLYLEATSASHDFTPENLEILENLTGYVLDLSHNIELHERQRTKNKKLAEQVEVKKEKYRTQKVLLEAQNVKINSSGQKLEKNTEYLQDQKGVLGFGNAYVRVIQEDKLPKQADMDKLFAKNFVMYQPVAFPASDFYRIYPLGKAGDKTSLVLTDTKKHGTPGGLLSIVTAHLLDRSIAGNKKPGEILQKLEEKSATDDLTVENSSQEIDIALVSFNPDKKQIEYAGANLDLYLYRNKKWEHVKSDAKPLCIGKAGGKTYKKQTFKTQTFSVKEGDILYLTTDGFKNQKGGKDKELFTEARFVDLLKEVVNMPLDRQFVRLENTFSDWVEEREGSSLQTDDVTVIAVQF